MAVEKITRIPGLLAADTAAIIYGKGLTAMVVSKSIVITDGDITEWIPEDVDYIVSNVEGPEVDEVVDLSGSKVDDNVVQLLMDAAYVALVAMNAGPVAARYLEKLEDESFAARQAGNKVRKTKEAKEAAPAKTTSKPVKTAKVKCNKQQWYLSNDGKGWTTDPSQAALDKQGKPWKVDNKIAAAS